MSRAPADHGEQTPAHRTGRGSGVHYAPHRRERRRHRAAHAVRRARERGVVLGFRGASTLLGSIPTGVTLPVARLAFRAGYLAWPGKRRIIRRNAARVLGLPASDPEVTRLARAIYAEYARFTLELLRLPTLPADEPSRLMRDEGGRGGSSFVRLYERLRADGRGMIVVSGHIGSIDVLAGAFAARGLPTYGVADDSAYPELLSLLNEQRQRWGVGVIPWRNLRQIFRVLRDAGILGLVVDWGYRPDDVPVRLFGSPTTLPAGPAVLAAKTGAPIVPAVNRRRPDGTYVATHFDPIEVADASPASVARATQQVADALQSMIATAPEQWYSFKPLWPATADEEALVEKRRLAMLAGGAPRADRR